MGTAETPFAHAVERFVMMLAEGILNSGARGKITVFRSDINEKQKRPVLVKNRTQKKRGTTRIHDKNRAL